MTEEPIEHYPHIRFVRVDIERHRHKRAYKAPPPSRDRVSYCDDLLKSVGTVQREFEEVRNSVPPEFNPALIFKVKTEGGIDEDTWRRSGLTLLGEEQENVVVLFSQDQLTEFSKRIGIFGLEDRGSEPAYNWIASVTTEMWLWSRHDRMGRKLKKIVINPDTTYVLDVELWNYGDREEVQARIQEIDQFVRNSGGQLLDTFVNHFLALARIKISGDTLNKLLDFGIIQSIDLPPTPEFTIGDLVQTPIDDFPNPPDPPPDGAIGICIIDSGIASGHPFLSIAIGETLPVPASIGSGIDQEGHGTKVAGIALYNNIKQCIDNLKFSPEFYLYGARVTNAQNQFDESKLIVGQMDEAIRYFYRNYGCRIFNISLGDPQLIYDGTKPSQWAGILDSLARELDIVIVVSAGNYGVVGRNGEFAQRVVEGYPSYLLEDDARIIEPATSAISITVGALAESEDAVIYGRYPNDPAYRCIARPFQPSPFTRSGPGVNGAIKPDVCEFGGNIIWNGHGNILSMDQGISVLSTNYQHIARLFTTDIGTSFATPKVAHLAGKILTHYPNISANLVRALIANSAQYPDGLTDYLGEENAYRLLGYGLPNLERAISSSINRVTLISEDSIQLDNFHIYQIPILDEFKTRRGKRQISVSLAFDPPVRHTRKEYLGIKMDFTMIRGLPLEEIINFYSAHPQDIEIPGLGQRYKCSLEPKSSKRNGGTLQKAVFIVSQNRSLIDYEGDNLFLVLRCKKSSWLSSAEIERQNYALVATIEHKEETVELYHQISQRIIFGQRVRV